MLFFFCLFAGTVSCFDNLFLSLALSDCLHLFVCGAVPKWQHGFAFYSSDIAVYFMIFFVYSFGLFIPFHGVFVLCFQQWRYSRMLWDSLTDCLFISIALGVTQGREVKRRAPLVLSVGAPGLRRALRTRTPIPLWPPLWYGKMIASVR